MQLAEKMESDVSHKRPRKKSRMARESDEMDFIESPPSPKKKRVTQEKGQKQQQLPEQLQSQPNNNSDSYDDVIDLTSNSSNNKRSGSSSDNNSRGNSSTSNIGNDKDNSCRTDNKGSNNIKHKQGQSTKKASQNTEQNLGTPKLAAKRGELKKKKSAEIEAAKTQAALSFRERYSDNTDTQNAAHPFRSHRQLLPTSLHSSLSPDIIHRSLAADVTNVATIPPPPEMTTLWETGSLIRSTLDMGNTIDDTFADIEVSTSEKSESYSSISSDEGSGRERSVPCKHCFALVDDLKAEIADFKKRQLPCEYNLKEIFTSHTTQYLSCSTEISIL